MASFNQPIIGQFKKPAIITIGAAFIVLCCNFIAPHEGVKYTAYKDTGGVYTLCFGHTKNVKIGDTATSDQCAEFLRQDTVEAVAIFNLLTNDAPIPPQAKKVFIDQIFNAGAGNFKKSTMRRLIVSGDFAGACRQFPRWKYVDGHDCSLPENKCRGIILRRQRQMDECLKGLQ